MRSLAETALLVAAWTIQIVGLLAAVVVPLWSLVAWP